MKHNIDKTSVLRLYVGQDVKRLSRAAPASGRGWWRYVCTRLVGWKSLCQKDTNVLTVGRD